MGAANPSWPNRHTGRIRRRRYLSSFRARQLCEWRLPRGGRRNCQEFAIASMPAVKRTFVLSLLPETFAICRLAPDAAVPEWATQGQFFSITRTSDELSIIAETALVPERLGTDVSWRVMKVHGPFDFSEVGILASLAGPLAAAGVSVFTISTFDTDYLLVQCSQLRDTVAGLRKAGHTVREVKTIS